MIGKSRIIVLHTIKHSDNGLIVQCYSNSSGREAMYLRISSRNKVALAHLHRLNILDVVTYRSGSSMPNIKELSPLLRLDSIRTDIYKNTIAIFLSELITKSVRESETNPLLYQFIESSVNLLEHLESGTANFHLHFMVHLCKFLGFMPMGNYSEEKQLFNFTTAQFVPAELYFDGEGARMRGENQKCCFSPAESQLLDRLLKTQAINLGEIKCNGELRLSFAKGMIRYFSYHLGIEMEIKSLDILHEIFR